MKKIIVLLVIVGFIVALNVFLTIPKSIKVGIYDSRAIAIAFYNSSDGDAYRLHAVEKMRMDSIENPAQVYQVLMHLQGFSIGSVSDILGNYKAEIDSVAKDAGVRIIVSKFELIYSDMDVDTVDVTLPLVRIFKPTERGLRALEGLNDWAPDPMQNILSIPANE